MRRVSNWLDEVQGDGFWREGVGSRKRIGVVLWGVVWVFSSWVQRWWRWRFRRIVRNIWRVCRALDSEMGSRGSGLGVGGIIGAVEVDEHLRSIDASCPGRWCIDPSGIDSGIVTPGT